MTNKIIIDTDIGDDIDDAFAIAFAVNSPEINVIAVTTVFRNAKKRAKMCSALLSSLRCEYIPVYAGIDQPLIASIEERNNDQYDNDGRFIPCQYDNEMEGYDYEKQHAVDFIIETINAYPGEITLVPIGPLTNIAIAIRKAPEIIKKVKEIVLMGGYFTNSFSEWNILCDPEAARIVFTSGINIKAVGLDVTLKCKLDGIHLEEFKKLSSNTCKLLTIMMNKWFKHYEFNCPVLHDPLTIGTLVSDQFVSFKNEIVQVALDKENYGQTIVKDDANDKIATNIMVAIDVDNEKYLELFKQRIFK